MNRGVVLGLALRVVRGLPRPLQRAVLGRASAGEPPPVADFVRMLEIAGDMPETGPTDAELFARFPQLAAVRVTEPAIDGVPARLYHGPGAPQAGFVWVHGGAFVSGSLRMAEAHFVALALAARGIAVLSLDYRKALHGGHFPQASDDVLAGWTWAVRNADRFGVGVERLHLGGASAGGNIVAGVSKRLRDGAGRAPASVVLVYPAVHPELPELSGELLAAVRRTPGAVNFTPGWVADMSLHYAGDADTLKDPYAFAANGDVGGLPPTLILNCEADTLRASGEAYADQLRAAGVPVTVHLEPGAAHGCVGDPFTVAARNSIDRMSEWLLGQPLS
ncbi:alpha/beta hydrolase fold domain-containing protein [Actinoplanes sp. NPDC024001]|uniref:alpha/beta hydrolase n=1 Tax=Actinoplanes sp. NPDC024001 TaxID=3154598 RepID=UPI0033C279E1